MARRWGRPQPVPPPPLVFLELAAYVGWPEPLRDRLWTAIKQAEMPGCVAFRTHLLFYDETLATRLGAEHMGRVICAPAPVIHVCEALHEAGLLSRRDTTDAQAQVLARTDAHGHWR